MPSRIPTSGPGTRAFSQNRRQVLMKYTDGSTTWMDALDAEWSLANADADASTVDNYTPKVRVS